MTQCTHVFFGAAGSGASGSSTTRAKLFVPGGPPDHVRGGETVSPSHVYLRGIAVPSLKPDEVSDIAIEAPLFSFAAAGRRWTIANVIATTANSRWFLKGAPPVKQA